MTIPASSRSPVRRGASVPRLESGSHSSPFHTAAQAIFLATIFAAPWAVGAVQPWAWGTLTILAIILLLLWGAGWAQRGFLRISWSPLYWPLMAFLLIATVQVAGGITADRVASREALLKLFTNAIFFFLAGQLVFMPRKSSRGIKRFGLVVTVLVIGVSVLALAQVMTTGHGLIYWSVRTEFGPFGPYVSANDYCGLLEMLIPISVGYILSGSSTKVPAVVLWSGVGVALVSIAISGSRGGAGVMLFELLLLGFILFRYWPRDAWRLGFQLVLLLVLVSAGVFAWMASGGKRADRALSIFQTDKSMQVKMGDRFWVARDTLRMAFRHPWLGIGVGAFETSFPPYMSRPSGLHWTHAHDDFAEGVAETGVMGGVLILWGLVLFFSLGYPNLKERFQSDWGWIPVGALVGATGLLCHSLVDFNLRVPANAVWFVVCVAVATNPDSWPERSSRSSRSSREVVPVRNEAFLN